MNKPYFCQNLFLKIDVICFVKIQLKYVQSIEVQFYGFFEQIENKLSKNMITFPSFSANMFPVILWAENFKINVIYE